PRPVSQSSNGPTPTGRPSLRHCSRPTPTSAGATTNNSPESGDRFPPCPGRTWSRRWRTTPATGTTARSTDMVDISTRYLGLDLRSPIVASASPLTRHPESVRRLEAAGAAAVVMPSLFEEEILHEETSLNRALEA